MCRQTPGKPSPDGPRLLTLLSIQIQHIRWNIFTKFRKKYAILTAGPLFTRTRSRAADISSRERFDEQTQRVSFLRQEALKEHSLLW